MASWKTTVLGLIIGALNMYANGTNWKQILISAGLAGFGVLAKDFDVSGQQPLVPK
jgi:hypothetical protein